MYYTYMLRCSDNSIYTGITTDLERRFKQHQGKVAGGAKYTKSKEPVRIEQAWTSPDRQSASKLEYRLKHLSKSEKELLVCEPDKLQELLAYKLDCSIYEIFSVKATTN